MADSTLIIEAIQKGNDEVLTKMDRKMDTKFAPVLNNLKIITDSLAKINTDIEEVQTRVSQNEDDIADLKAKVAFLEKENTYLKNKAQDTENRNRMSNLRFIGVPRRSNEPRKEQRTTMFLVVHGHCHGRLVLQRSAGSSLCAPLYVTERKRGS